MPQIMRETQTRHKNVIAFRDSLIVKPDFRARKEQYSHRGSTQSVWVADCYFIVNVLDLPFASPIEEQSTANSIAQKTAFEAKGRLYTTGKVIQCLFIINLYTQLAIYGYR